MLVADNFTARTIAITGLEHSIVANTCYRSSLVSGDDARFAG